MRIIFFGSADFGIPALRSLIQKHEIVAVVSTPPKPAGRGLVLKDSPVVDYACSEIPDVPLYKPESLNDPGFIRKIRLLNVDCFIVVAFRLIPRAVFTIPPLGTLNIHASLLPAYRGPAPIQRAIEAGETKTGITIFRIDDGIDTGEILEQVEVEIGAEETAPELYARLSAIGADTLCRVLDSIEKGICKPRPQRHSAATKAPRLKKEEALIDWRLPANVIFNKVRAFKPFPGTYTLVNGKRLGIEWARPDLQKETEFPCGTISRIASDCFEVQTGRGILRVESVKPEGRKTISATDYLRGTKTIKEGFRFGE